MAAPEEDANKKPEKPKTNYSAKKDEIVGGAETKKKVEKVISGEAVQRKKSLGRRISESFTGEDVRSAGTYIVFDVLIPAAKAMISDAVSQGIERILFGDSRRGGSGGSRKGYTVYNNMYKGDTSSRPATTRDTNRARATHNFDDIVLATREEAEDVLLALQAIIDQYDVATISDFYELVGITGSYTDDKYGWSDLKGAGYARNRHGFVLNLPRTSSLN